jgi:hypothetical protein
VFLIGGTAVEVTVSGTRADVRGALAGIDASVETLTYAGQEAR